MDIYATDLAAAISNKIVRDNFRDGLPNCGWTGSRKYRCYSPEDYTQAGSPVGILYRRRYEDRKSIYRNIRSRLGQCQDARERAV